jgi:hypothetical protein
MAKRKSDRPIGITEEQEAVMLGANRATRPRWGTVRHSQRVPIEAPQSLETILYNQFLFVLERIYSIEWYVEQALRAVEDSRESGQPSEPD